MKQQPQDIPDAVTSDAGVRPPDSPGKQQSRVIFDQMNVSTAIWAVLLTIVLIGVGMAALVQNMGNRIHDRIDSLATRMETGFRDADAKRETGFRDADAKRETGFRDADAKREAGFRKIDALDAKVDDICVYIAAVHGDTITFAPVKAAKNLTWLIQAVNRETREVQDIGKLTVQAGTPRRAVLEFGKGGPTREWTHLDLVDTLRRAKRVLARAAAP